MTNSEDFSAQRAPVAVAHSSGNAWLKIELAVRDGDSLLVAGWRVGDLDLRVTDSQAPLSVQLACFYRPDVNAHFGLEADFKAGFVLLLAEADATSLDSLLLQVWEREDLLQQHRLEWQPLEAVPASDLHLLGPGLAQSATRHRFGSAAWSRAISLAPRLDPDPHVAQGFLEAAAEIAGTGHLLVTGWVASSDEVPVWLQDAKGRAFGLHGAHRYLRRDVARVVCGRFGEQALQASFALHLQGVQIEGGLQLMALGREGVHVLASVHCENLCCSVRDVAKWLSSHISCPRMAQEGLLEQVHLPVLDAVNTQLQRVARSENVLWQSFGQQPEQPRASIIVPLYGRFDFAESQMLEWVRDPAIGRSVELIYVVDDPGIVEAVQTEAVALHSLYQCPFRLAVSGRNRGFSGANNLGASEARGEVLVFLNSDAIPCGPGWVEGLCDLLDAHPQFGALGPRLLFADGGIQHAGMRFEWLPEFSIWSNQHPHAGLAPELDPARGLTEVPAVTGACLAIPRTHFDAVEGWDTGYLIGDFEDSDLCLKLRSRGLKIGYTPDIELVHLERQSMPLHGDAGYRQQITLLNARRHQQRWAEWLRRDGQRA